MSYGVWRPALDGYYGQHNAPLVENRCARHQTIITIDDDLQHPPEDISALLAWSSSSADVIPGTPLRARLGFARRLSPEITKLVLKGAKGADIAVKASPSPSLSSILRTSEVSIQAISVFTPVDGGVSLLSPPPRAMTERPSKGNQRGFASAQIES